MEKRIKCGSENFYDLCVSYLQSWSKGEPGFMSIGG